MLSRKPLLGLNRSDVRREHLRGSTRRPDFPRILDALRAKPDELGAFLLTLLTGASQRTRAWVEVYVVVSLGPWKPEVRPGFFEEVLGEGEALSAFAALHGFPPWFGHA